MTEPPDVSERPKSPRRSRVRGRSLVIGSTILGAALALIAVLLVWVRQHYGADLSGSLSRKGSQVAPAVVPLALVALAGLVAAFAGRGLVGRLVGAVLVAAGIALMLSGLLPVLHPPHDATSGDAGLPAPAELMGPVRVQLLGPLLAMVGGALVVVAGVAVLVGAINRRLGTRFDAPTSARSARTVRDVPSDVRDADAAASWWKALDRGGDPTEEVNEAAAPPDGAVRSHPPGRLP